MSATRLNVGGFTQPGVARNIIEMPSNSEKGFSHRFLWLELLFGKLETLTESNTDFTEKIGMSKTAFPQVICYFLLSCSNINVSSVEKIQVGERSGDEKL